MQGTLKKTPQTPKGSDPKPPQTIPTITNPPTICLRYSNNSYFSAFNSLFKFAIFSRTLFQSVNEGFFQSPLQTLKLVVGMLYPLYICIDSGIQIVDTTASNLQTRFQYQIESNTNPSSSLLLIKIYWFHITFNLVLETRL